MLCEYTYKRLANTWMLYGDYPVNAGENDETKKLPSTRYVIFSFIRRSQAFVTFAKAFVSIRNIRKGLTRNSAHCL